MPAALVWWTQRLARLRDDLLAAPALFAFVLLALRQVVTPYLGLFHDAQLYGLQATQRLAGGYGDDLFFAHGSQDQYSVFSWLVAPLVQTLGLSVAFFLVYTVASYLVLWASCRFMTRLVDDADVRFMAALVMGIVTVPYGGWGIFHVHEPFLTARLPATALVLFTFDRALVHRPLQAWMCVLLAIAFHPIMGAVGAAILIAYHVRDVSIPRLGSGVALGSMLAFGALAAALATGKIALVDPEWLATTRAISPQCFPSDWKIVDGVDLILALVINALALPLIAPRGRWLLCSMMLSAILGTGLAFVIERFPIPLLLQAQPMRAVWPLMAFTGPLSVVVAHAWMRAGSGLRYGAGILILLFGARLCPVFFAGSTQALLLLPLGVFAGMALAALGGSSLPTRTSWIRWGGLAGLLFMTLLFSLRTLVLFYQKREVIGAVAEPCVATSVALRASGEMLPLLLALVVLALVGQGASRMGTARRWGAFAGFFFAATLWTTASSVPPGSAEDSRFVEESLRARRLGEQPVVYWPTDIRRLWFEAKVPAYYHFAQVQGAVFRRATALEARRRVELVRPFEVTRAHELGIAASWDRLRRVLGPIKPTKVDEKALTRLLDDTQLDVVVLPYAVGHLPARTNGHIWIYDGESHRRQNALTARAPSNSNHQEYGP